MSQLDQEIFKKILMHGHLQIFWKMDWAEKFSAPPLTPVTLTFSFYHPTHTPCCLSHTFSFSSANISCNISNNLFGEKASEIVSVTFEIFMSSIEKHFIFSHFLGVIHFLCFNFCLWSIIYI